MRKPSVRHVHGQAADNVIVQTLHQPRIHVVRLELLHPVVQVARVGGVAQRIAPGFLDHPIVVRTQPVSDALGVEAAASFGFLARRACASDMRFRDLIQKALLGRRARGSSWGGAERNCCPRPSRFRARRCGTSPGRQALAPDGCATAGRRDSARWPFRNRRWLRDIRDYRNGRSLGDQRRSARQKERQAQATR